MPRVNHTDEGFKKTEQVVGKSAVTTHNINDEYMKNAPQNRGSDFNEHKQEWPRNFNRGEVIADDANRVDNLPTNAVDEDLGRAQHTDDLAGVAQEHSVHR